jgi:hypothetical protein
MSSTYSKNQAPASVAAPIAAIVPAASAAAFGRASTPSVRISKARAPHFKAS